jgi:hypothetical protein
MGPYFRGGQGGAGEGGVLWGWLSPHKSNYFPWNIENYPRYFFVGGFLFPGYLSLTELT